MTSADDCGTDGKDQRTGTAGKDKPIYGQPVYCAFGDVCHVSIPFSGMGRRGCEMGQFADRIGALSGIFPNHLSRQEA